MRKKIIIALSLIGLIASASDYEILVPAETSYKVVPRAGIRSAPDWVTGVAVAQGAVRESGKKLYMAVHAGTTGATAPTHSSGIVSDGTVSWLQCSKNARDQALVTQSIDGKIWYHDSTAVEGGGVYHLYEGQVYSDTSSGAIYVWLETEMLLNIKDRR